MGADLGVCHRYIVVDLIAQFLRELGQEEAFGDGGRLSQLLHFNLGLVRDTARRRSLARHEFGVRSLHVESVCGSKVVVVNVNFRLS